MTIGVDVSKETLVWSQPDTKPANVSNDVAAITAWLATLPAGTTVAMEATGRYHRLLAETAVAHGFRVLVLNPRDVHHYALSLTPRAITDPIMAQVIAQYAAVTPQLPVYQPAPAYVDEVRTLMRVRWGLVQQKVRLGHQRREAPALAPVVDPLLAEVQRGIARLTTQLIHRVHTQPALVTLEALPGVGPLTAAYLLILLATHRFPRSDAFVAFLGWDLRIKDSGKARKQHELTKRGDPEGRRLLYLAAQTAARMPGPFQTLHQRARAQGWQSTEATVIVARKLARVAWSLYTYETTYDPQRVLTQ